MKTFGLLAVLFLLFAAPAAEEVLFQDDFKDKLGEGWTWIREDRASWRVTKEGLEVRVQPGNMWGSANDAKNVLVRPVPDPAKGTIEVSVIASNRPAGQYEQADLVCYYDDGNMVKIGLEQVDQEICVVMGREEADKTRTIGKIVLGEASVGLRFVVSGDKIRGQFRPGGESKDGSWKDAGECTLPAKGSPKASLQVYQGPPGADRWARFSAFRIIRRRG
jgi:regulation of enolase protein 1 (concanavalin A-like superfamily)